MLQAINSVSGSDLPVGGSLESCTSEVKLSRRFELDGRTVELIDTPGFDDSDKSARLDSPLNWV